MKKRRIKWLALPLCLLSMLTGCWDYKGMAEFNIVAGVSVDKGVQGGPCELMLEIVDLTTAQEGQRQKSNSIFVETEGPTHFEALRNAKKRLYSTLYFGGMQLIVISREVAERDGIEVVLDTFIRNYDPRKNTFVVISLEDTAKEIFQTDSLDAATISYELARIVDQSHAIDASTPKIQMYEIFQMLNTRGRELVLPTAYVVQNDDRSTPEVGGIAVFKEDKMVGVLSSEQTRYFLMATDGRTQGAFSIPQQGDSTKQMAYRVYRCSSKPKLDYADGTLEISLTVNLELAIAEYNDGKRLFDEMLVEALTAQTEAVLKSRIRNVFYAVQTDCGVDIFGYGSLIRRDDYQTWVTIEEQWDEIFQQAEFHVEVNVKIIDFGFINK